MVQYKFNMDIFSAIILCTIEIKLDTLLFLSRDAASDNVFGRLSMDLNKVKRQLYVLFSDFHKQTR